MSEKKNMNSVLRAVAAFVLSNLGAQARSVLLELWRQVLNFGPDRLNFGHCNTSIIKLLRHSRTFHGYFEQNLQNTAKNDTICILELSGKNTKTAHTNLAILSANVFYGARCCHRVRAFPGGSPDTCQAV